MDSMFVGKKGRRSVVVSTVTSTINVFVLFKNMFSLLFTIFAFVIHNIKSVKIDCLSFMAYQHLFNAKSSLYIYIKYIWFGLVGFYGISTIAGYLMPNPLLHIYQIYMIWFGWVLWHINHCRLFDAKSSLYIYIKYIWFGLVGFYGISTIVCYSIPNPLYTYILDI